VSAWSVQWFVAQFSLQSGVRKRLTDHTGRIDHANTGYYHIKYGGLGLELG